MSINAQDSPASPWRLTPLRCCLRLAVLVATGIAYLASVEVCRHQALVALENLDLQQYGTSNLDVERRVPDAVASRVPGEWADKWFVSLRSFLLVGDNPKSDSARLRLIKTFPELRELVLENSRVDAELLTQVGRLSKIRSLKIITGELPDGLFGLNHLQHLESLTIYTSSQTPLDFSGLDDLPSLSALSLRMQALDADQLQHLAKLPHLKLLTIEARKISTSGLQALVDIRPFAELRVGSPTLYRTWSYRPIEKQLVESLQKRADFHEFMPNSFPP